MSRRIPEQNPKTKNNGVCVMRATVEYVERKYDDFNKLIFEGKLKKPPFFLINTLRIAGRFRFKLSTDEKGAAFLEDCFMEISRRLDVPENILEDVIIHEMIHQWVMTYKDVYCTHGDAFLEKMRDINTRFNRNVSVKAPVKDYFYTDDLVRMHYGCVYRKPSGGMGIVLFYKSTLPDFVGTLCGMADCGMETSLFWSKDPFFNRFKRSHKYKASLLKLGEHIANMHPLSEPCEGRSLPPCLTAVADRGGWFFER